MPKSKIIVSLGAVVAIIPHLGFPRAWESFFLTLIGLSIVGTFIWNNIDRKMTLKAKAVQRRMAHKRQQEEVSTREVVENTDVPSAEEFNQGQ